MERKEGAQVLWVEGWYVSTSQISWLGPIRLLLKSLSSVSCFQLVKHRIFESGYNTSWMWLSAIFPFPPAFTLIGMIRGQDVFVTGAWIPSYSLFLWIKTFFSFKMEVLLGGITHHIFPPQYEWSHAIQWQAMKISGRTLGTQERKGHTNEWCEATVDDSIGL